MFSRNYPASDSGFHSLHSSHSLFHPRHMARAVMGVLDPHLSTFAPHTDSLTFLSGGLQARCECCAQAASRRTSQEDAGGGSTSTSTTCSRPESRLPSELPRLPNEVPTLPIDEPTALRMEGSLGSVVVTVAAGVAAVMLASPPVPAGSGVLAKRFFTEPVTEPSSLRAEPSAPSCSGAGALTLASGAGASPRAVVLDAVDLRGRVEGSQGVVKGNEGQLKGLARE